MSDSLLNEIHQKCEAIAAKLAETKPEVPKPKDRWDKADILGKSLLGLGTVTATVWIGWNTNELKRKELDLAAIKAGYAKLSPTDKENAADTFSKALPPDQQAKLTKNLAQSLPPKDKPKFVSEVSSSFNSTQKASLGTELLSGTGLGKLAAESYSKALDSKNVSPELKQVAVTALQQDPQFQQMPSPDPKASPLGQKALALAIQELKAGASDQGGENQGPFAKKYLEATGLTVGQPWATAFVSWCFQEAAKPNATPFKPTAYGPSLLSEFREKGWLIKRPQDAPMPGDIMWTTNGKASRIRGIVQRTYKDKVCTIQGNFSEPENAQFGTGAVAGRIYMLERNQEFGRIPNK